MHSEKEIGSFLVLRANGWSITKISKKLNVPKSTIWEWDCKNADQIQALKLLQLEKLQEEYLPTYEDELKQLSSYLAKVEHALASQDFSKMTPEFLLQTSLQLRARLNKMREQLPLRVPTPNTPHEPLPYTGCVAKGDVIATAREDFKPEMDEDDAKPAEVGRDVPMAPDTGRARPASDSPPIDNGQPDNPRSGHTPRIHDSISPASNGNGHPASNGHPSRNGHCKPNELVRGNSCDPCLENRKEPDRDAGGLKNEPSESTT